MGAEIVLTLGLKCGAFENAIIQLFTVSRNHIFHGLFRFLDEFFFLIFDSNYKIHLQLRYLNIKGVNECIFVNYYKGVFSLLNSGEMFLKSRNQDVCFYGSFDPRFQFKVKRVTKYS